MTQFPTSRRTLGSARWGPQLDQLCVRRALARVSWLREARRRALAMVRPANAMRHPTFAERHRQRAAIAEVDYFRYSTMGLAVERVIDDDIGGALAEVGDWRGEVSRFLQGLAPIGPCFLFDTFEGFHTPPDLDPDRPVDTRFRDTSAAAVARRVGTDPNVRIRPGRVPETFAGLEREGRAFVLMEVDPARPSRALGSCIADVAGGIPHRARLQQSGIGLGMRERTGHVHQRDPRTPGRVGRHLGQRDAAESRGAESTRRSRRIASPVTGGHSSDPFSLVSASTSRISFRRWLSRPGAAPPS